MTDPDQTPILNKIDRALHAVQKRDPAEAIKAYREAALRPSPPANITVRDDRYLAVYCPPSLTSPTITGTASDLSNCPCTDGTGTCAYKRIEGGMVWSCGACHREWIVADTHTEEDDTGYWSSVVVFLAVFGSGVVLGLGVLIGYVWRGWSA